MKKHYLIFVSVIILLIAGCGSSKKNKIGVMLPTSGDVAEYGKGALGGVELAHKLINMDNIELVLEDSQCDGKAAVNSINKLISVENVVAIIGELCSSATLAAAPVAEENHVVLISPASTSPKITEAGDYIFRTIPTDARQGVFAAELISDEGYDKLATLYPNEDYGKGFSEVIEKSFIEMGGKVVRSESFERGSTDVRSQLTKIKRSNPDVLFLISNSPDAAIAALRQIKELGITAALYGSEGLKADSIAQADGAEGLVITSVNPGSTEFSDNHNAEFGRDPGPFAAQGYDAYMALAKAIEDGATTGEEIKNKLYEISFTGVTGEVEFDENGDVGGSYDIYKVIDGQFEKL